MAELCGDPRLTTGVTSSPRGTASRAARAEIVLNVDREQDVAVAGRNGAGHGGISGEARHRMIGRARAAAQADCMAEMRIASSGCGQLGACSAAIRYSPRIERWQAFAGACGYRVTMSFFIGARIATSSFCSRAGTLNFFSVLPRSPTSALKWLERTPMPAWASFMLRPV